MVRQSAETGVTSIMIGLDHWGNIKGLSEDRAENL